MLISKKRRAIAATAALISAMTMFTVFSASAGPQAGLPDSEFEIDVDANLTFDGERTWDWNNVEDTKGIDLATGSNDDSYKGGVKEDTECPDEVTGSIPNNKSDLLTLQAWEEPGNAANPVGYFNFAWSRVSDPSGTTLMDFEFNQSATACAQGPNVTRTEGDLLIEYAITQGGATATILGRTWDGTANAWRAATTLSVNSPLCGGSPCAAGTINTSPILAANSDGLIASGVKGPRTFGEAQIDLRLLLDTDECVNFGSMMVKSRSSDAFTSQLKDFISPIPINLTNCGQVIIRKETLPDEDPNATLFDYDSNIVTDPVVPQDFQLTDDGVQTFSAVVQNDYFVNELAPPSGWEFVSLDCSASSASTEFTITGTRVDFTIDEAIDTLDCTYTNQAKASLHFVKDAERGGVDFSYATTGGLDPSTFDLADGEQQDYADLAPGTYGATETVPAGWNLTSSDCDNGDVAAAVTLAGGDDVTCTFVNVIERGAVLVHKTAKHAAAPGTDPVPHAGVTFTVTNATNGTNTSIVTNAQGFACVDNLPVSVLDGVYTVAETVPAGYVGGANQTVTVVEGTCATASADTAAEFVNTPLTNVTVSVDSIIPGGTASIINCGGADVPTDPVTGDGSLTVPNLQPTAPAVTLTCTITIDP